MAAAGAEGPERDSDGGGEELELTPAQLIRSLEQVCGLRAGPRAGGAVRLWPRWGPRHVAGLCLAYSVPPFRPG